MNNAGTIQWQGTGDLNTRNTILNNLAGGLFDIQNNAVFNWWLGTPPAFNNAGIDGPLAPVDEALAGKDYLIGDFSAADIMLGHACFMSNRLGCVPDEMSNLKGYVERVAGRWSVSSEAALEAFREAIGEDGAEGWIRCREEGIALDVLFAPSEG